MTKQEYILKILNSIDNTVFPIGNDIKALIETGNISNDLVDTLIAMFTQAVHTTTDKLQQQKLQKSIILLNNMKAKEEQSKIEDQHDIEALEELINTM